MASADIVVLSSSPVRPFRTFQTSSSPGLPSPSEIFHRKPSVLQPGSRMTAVPHDAPTSFTPASSLLMSRSFNNQTGSNPATALEFDPLYEIADLLNIRKSDEVQARALTAACDNEMTEGMVAKSIQKTSAIDTAPAGKAPRKPRAKELDLKEAHSVQEKPAPKPRARKAAVQLDDDGNVKHKPPAKSKTKKVDIADGIVKQKPLGKSRAKTPLGSALIDDEKTGKPVKKTRAKKGDGQTKIKNTKVTKPSVDKKLKDHDETTAAKDPEITSRHFSGGRVDIGLAPALRRRASWTPPPASHGSVLCDIPTLEDEMPGTESAILDDTLKNRGTDFANLLDSFGFSSDTSAAVTKVSDDTGMKKRKLIELVRANSISEAASAPKPKVGRKKARTLTDLATSVYAQEEEEEIEPPAPLLQYFSLKTVERKNGDGFKMPSKPRSKSPVKRVGKGKGRGTEQAPILLSPESALKQVGNQDFVFGTSSQLAREDSPSFLRDIHAAMQASNVLGDDDSLWEPSLNTPSLSSDSVSRPTSVAKPGLWSAAARNINGELLDVELVDLVDSPALKVTRDESKKDEAVPLLSEVHDEEWRDLDDVSSSPLPSQRVSSPKEKTIGPIEAAIRNELSSPSAPIPQLVGSSKAAKKSNPLDLPNDTVLSPSKKTKASQSSKESKSNQPDFTAFTNAQLSKEIAKYHFKPIKNRDNMINLLERCWEGKHRLALQALGTNTIVGSSQSKESKSPPKKAPSSQLETASPKRPRGRPRKDSTASTSPKSKVKVTMTVENLELDSDTPLSQIRTPRKTKKKAVQHEDISDSEAHMTPSPPRRRPSQVGTPPLPMRTSSTALGDETADLSPSSSQLQLFKHITQVVTTAPRSEDSKNPSWHEKILLYDPIVLEDLTVWLNAGALDKAGWDGEVEPKEVKKWCESKSICCLWRENLRGGARSRY